MRAPNRVEDIAPSLVADLQGALGDDLEAVCLYGAASGDRYQKGRTPIRLLVLAGPAANRPGALAGFHKKWASAGVEPPLVMNSHYIETSTDAFPIEFLTMAAEHQCLLGQDPLAGLDISPTDLRLQLERELKGKLITLRSGIIECQGRKDALLDLAFAAAPAFTKFFQAYLQLVQGGFPAAPAEVMDQAAAAGLQVDGFKRLVAVAQGQDKPAANQLLSLLHQVVTELDAICDHVDQLPAGQKEA